MLHCQVCEKPLKKKEVRYDEHGRVYCPNPFECTEEHPNSPQNIVKRGYACDLYDHKTYATRKLEGFEELDDETKLKLERIVKKPQSIRINDYAIAYYLLTLKEQYGLSSLSEAIRHCVSYAMKANQIEQPQPQEQEQPQPQEKEQEYDEDLVF